jgi:hypothetical protein
MPKYRIELDGRTFELEGDHAPTEAEARAAIGEHVASQPPAPVPVTETRGWGRTLGDVAIGALKGAGSTATNLGNIVAHVPVVGPALTATGNALGGAVGRAVYGEASAPVTADQATKAAREVTTATNTAQSIGKGAEQIAETLVPAGAVSAAGKGLGLAGRVGLEAATGASMSAAQGGNPLVGGVVGGALPAVGAVAGAVVPALKESAAKQVVQALGPTKERFKAMAERITPEILKRGLRGSREALQSQAAEAASVAGDKIDDAIQQFGSRQVGTKPLVDALETAKSAFQTLGPNGAPIVFEPRAVNQLSGLQKIVSGFGPDIRVDQLVAVRRAWDKVVDQAGGFAHRAQGAIGMPLKDASEAATKREATTAIRKLLDTEVPELSVLNKEFSFWKSLDDVMTQTMKRTQPQGPGLLKTGAETVGQIVGGVVGSTHGPAGAVGGAVALGKVSKMATMVFNSPRWKLASAQAKDALADAIVSDDAGRIATALGRIAAVQGSKIGQ